MEALSRCQCHFIGRHDTNRLVFFLLMSIYKKEIGVRCVDSYEQKKNIIKIAELSQC